MKFFYKTILSLFILFSLSCLVGCLKDKAFDKGIIQSVHNPGQPPVVAIGLTAGSTANFLFLSLNASNTDTTIDLIPLILASPNPAPQDVNLTLSPDTALLNAYNAANGSSYVLPDPSIYKIVSATIPKGSNSGFAKVQFKTSDLPQGAAFAFTITGAPAGYIISSNLGSGIVAIGVRNQWDGRYQIKGTVLRAGDPVLSGTVPSIEYDLITSSQNSVTFGALQQWANGSGVGIGFPVLTIDNSTVPNPVTISSSGGASNAPGYNSRYDPATKTFYISFTWGAGPAARLATDTLTYLGPR